MTAISLQKTGLVWPMESTREGFGLGLLDVGRERDDVVVVAADTGKSMRAHYFAKEFPERSFDTGIAEQDMILVAAGLASAGKTAFATTYATLASLRACEQIRSFVAYPNLNVKVVTGMSGLSGDLEGVTHQGIEDIGVMRSIPNMTVVCPADAVAARKAVAAITEYQGPVYMRVGRNKSPVVYREDMDFVLGKAVVHRDNGSDIAILATGLALPIALEAEALLAKDGINGKVVEFHTVKPIDKDTIIELAEDCRTLITVEDHNIIGGLGSAVAEVISEHSPCLLKRVGIADVFGESAPYEELLNAYGISSMNVYTQAKELLKKTL